MVGNNEEIGHYGQTLITPTTTMMREGILQTSTKIDSGFNGILNWSLRNGFSKEILLQYKEPIFKLTLFKLIKEENPGIEYGSREHDKYGYSDKIMHSERKIPAHIPKNQIINRDLRKLTR